MITRKFGLYQHVQQDRLRLGEFSFLNCAPVRWGLEAAGGGCRATLSGAPRQVIDALLAGELDVGPVSLVEYLRHTDELTLLPGLAIGSDGPVMSCHLVARRPLEELGLRPVGLGSDSRTAVLLARLLLEDAIKVQPVYHRAPPKLAEMLADADAAVLIGDAALAALVQGIETVHDLGEMWRAWTGLPMVFAVWTVRRHVAQARPAAVAAVHEALLDALELARQRPADVAAASGDRFSVDVLTTYFSTLDYTLSDRHLAGIGHFANLAAAKGAVPAAMHIDFFTEDRRSDVHSV